MIDLDKLSYQDQIRAISVQIAGEIVVKSKAGLNTSIQGMDVVNLAADIERFIKGKS